MSFLPYQVAKNNEGTIDLSAVKTAIHTERSSRFEDQHFCFDGPGWTDWARAWVFFWGSGYTQEQNKSDVVYSSSLHIVKICLAEISIAVHITRLQRSERKRTWARSSCYITIRIRASSSRVFNIRSPITKQWRWLLWDEREGVSPLWSLPIRWPPSDPPSSLPSTLSIQIRCFFSSFYFACIMHSCCPLFGFRESWRNGKKKNLNRFWMCILWWLLLNICMKKWKLNPS